MTSNELYMTNAAPQTANNVIDATQLFQSNNPKQLDAKPRVSIISSLKRMRSACENWERTAFATANDMLYALLAECYELESKLDRAATRELTSYCDSNGIRYLKSTTPLAKLIKSVFGVDRRRVSTYVTALRAARQQSVTAQNLAAWLRERGGVQEASMQRGANYKTAKQKAQLAGTTVFNQPVLANFASAELLKHFSSADGDGVLLIATVNADNTFSVRRLVQNNSALNAVLSNCYSAVIKQTAAEQPAAQAAARQPQVQAAVAGVASLLSAAA